MYSKLKPLSSSGGHGQTERSPHTAGGTTRAQLLARERAAARSRAVAMETRASIAAFEVGLRQSALPSMEQRRPYSTGSVPDRTPTHTVVSGPIMTPSLS